MVYEVYYRCCLWYLLLGVLLLDCMSFVNGINVGFLDIFFNFSFCIFDLLICEDNEYVVIQFFMSFLCVVLYGFRC